jgi:uncharacterized SAM-binding protein YcdF (DUF218 family)
MFRRHLRAIVSFAVAVLVLILLLGTLMYLAKSGTVLILSAALFAPLVVGCALVAVSVVLYSPREPREKAEWSVLAPVVAASTVVAGHWNHIVGPLILSSHGSDVSAQWVAAVLVKMSFLVGICVLGAALATRWMERQPTTGRAKGLGHNLAAVAILTMLVQGFLAGAQEIAWRIFATPHPDLDAILAQSAMCRAQVLVGLLTAWLVIAIVVWRGADRLSRWRLISLFSVWVCLDTWIGDLHWALPQIRPYEWTWALAIGVEAGLIAVLYGRLVVQRLWIRASPLSST